MVSPYRPAFAGLGLFLPRGRTSTPIRENKLFPYYPFVAFSSCSTKTGVPGAIRTPDPLLRRQLLYPTELQGHKYNNQDPKSKLYFTSSTNNLLQIPTILSFWSGRKDLNLRLLGPKPSALAKLSHAPRKNLQSKPESAPLKYYMIAPKYDYSNLFFAF